MPKYTLPEKSEVKQAVDDSDSVLEATRTLRVSRECLQTALWEYDMAKPDYWISSPKQAIQSLRDHSGDRE